MLLDVPFITDGEYPAFLADHAQRLCSVHFSVSEPDLQDARQRMSRGDLDGIIDGLNALGSVDRYVLMNARLHASHRYFDDDGLARTSRILERLLDEADLTGIVFADGYFLGALSSHAPKTMARLEAIPSINCMLDSSDKVFATLAMIRRTAFRQPSRLVLDRALNRDDARFQETSTRLRQACPNLRLLLMANEGCLHQCPYKSAHDAHISLVNEGLCGERTFAMNRDFGCVRRMLDDPGAMLASPFIRPEDQGRYAAADGIKICGRNRGPEFLMRAVSAYLDEKHRGNLLDLMDAMGDLSDRVHIPNESLPADFADRVAACDKQCETCGWCAAVMNGISSRHDPELPDFAQ